MKKTAIFLSVVLCASLLFCVPVGATGVDVDLYVKTKGTNITVTLKTDAALGAIQGVVYNGDDIEYVSATVSSGISAQNTTSSTFRNNSANGATKIALVGNPASGTSGTWATFAYTAEEGTPADITLSNFKAFSANGSAQDAVFTVVMPGDVNEDKLVNVKDYVRYKNIVGGAVSGPAVVKNKDVDMNGVYNDSRDFAQLKNDLLDS